MVQLLAVLVDDKTLDLKLGEAVRNQPLGGGSWGELGIRSWFFGN